MFFLWSNECEIIAAIFFVLAYIGLHLLSQPQAPRLSYLAIFAAMSVVLNPQLIHIVLVRVHFPHIIYRGDSEFRSFAAGMVALVTGICAVVRIMRSKGKLKGLPFAIAGIGGGSLWAGAWAVFYVRFMWAMSGWH